MSETQTDSSRSLFEAKAAMTDFVNDFRMFQGRIETRLKAQDDRIALLDRKSAARPALAADAPAQTKALGDYLRHGDEAGLRAVALEQKGLTTAVNNEGGFLVGARASDSIRGVLNGAASIRAVAQVTQVDGGLYEVLVDHGDIGAGWSSETAAASETGVSALERISIPLHELAAMPKASQRLLEDSAFDVESWLIERAADRFAKAESKAFVIGDGVNQPKGFLAHEQVANSGWDWGKIGYVATGADGDFNAADPADSLIDLVYALDAAYRANAVFVMNSRSAGLVRRFKDASGRFLWAESMQDCGRPTLLGHAVVTCEDMPDIGSGAAAIAFGDFNAGYTIVERPDLRVLRDPYSAKPHVQFYCSARIGGDVTDFAAIKLLKFSAS